LTRVAIRDRINPTETKIFNMTRLIRALAVEHRGTIDLPLSTKLWRQQKIPSDLHFAQ
jgi:hypothetical protein